MKTQFFSFLLLSIFITTSTQAQITNDKIWSGLYSPKSVDGIHSMADGEHFVIHNREGLDQYSYSKQMKTKTLVSGQFIDYKFSADEKLILLQTSYEPIYRHSNKGAWKVYHVENQQFADVFEGKAIQEPTFSPDGSKLAFVYENNLYIQEMKGNKLTQITTDGKKDKIINGICDWVYEEEFGFVRHFDWNADGTVLAFAKFDESAVPKIDISVYQNQLYPGMFSFKYPKAGEVNSKVNLYVHHLGKNKTEPVNLGNIENYYLRKIKFSKDAQSLFVITSNRHQNKAYVNQLNMKNMKIQTLFTEESPAWIDMDNLTLEFLSDNSFVWNSERSGYRHMYHYSADGKKAKPLTYGEWEVTEWYGLNEKEGTFYYQSTQDGPVNRTVYKGYMAKKPAVLLSEKTGSNKADFSNNFNYFINTYSAADIPPIYTLRNAKGETLSTLENNQKLANEMQDENLNPKEFIQIPNSNGDMMNAWMIKPSDFDASKKYPLLMYVYGGPGSQTVENSWGNRNYWWFQSLAQKGYIIVSVDGRGTGGRGTKYKQVTYKQLGKYEIEDQITAGKWLAKQSYIDADRVGMFGWSYGGYMTSLAMTKGAEVFSTGIAVAPVTNWRYYDTIYTERFMQTPQENASGYDDNSPINHVDKLKGNYLLIHGTADDNVHFQNSVEMIEALVQANKQFDVMIYPDKNHSIYGGNTRLHLYNKMTDFLLNNL